MNGSILNIPNPMGLVENATQIAKNVIYKKSIIRSLFIKKE